MFQYKQHLIAIPLSLLGGLILPILLTKQMRALTTGEINRISPMTSTQCAEMKAKDVMRDNAPIQCDRLRNVMFRYIDFEGQTHDGKVIVLDTVAQRVQTIFDTLYARKFPLNKAVPMEHYHGDDDASMNDNNSSAFNARPITGGTEWSLHAYGVAIDINPLQNPYISFSDDGTLTILPKASAKAGTVNRLKDRPGKNTRPGFAEDIVDIFANNGFLDWGGYWDERRVDYQHFAVGSQNFVKRLASASPADAQRIFEQYVNTYIACMAQQSTTESHHAARVACVAKVMQ